MARINTDTTIILTEEEREILTKAVEICEQISDEIRYSIDFVFFEIASNYNEDNSHKLPLYIYLD
jgi:hypothetical protein